MKKIILLPFLLLAISAFSQVIFEDLSFNQALQKAKETGKLIFLQYEAEDCSQCNEVANKAFEDQKLGETLNQVFVCIKISPTHPDRNLLATLYSKNKNSFGSLFIATDKTIVHSYLQTTTLPRFYFDEIDKALTKSGEGIRLSSLEKEYQNGNKNPGLIELILETRKSLNLDTDRLLEEYVSSIPADSLKSIRYLVFIAKMAPVLETMASNLLRKDIALFYNAWQSIDLKERISINGQIINKSLQKAIKDKNEEFAYRIANFTQSTYTSNRETGEKVASTKIIEYYNAIKDNNNYLLHSIAYYDKYYLGISIDSIKKVDTLRLKKLGEQQIPIVEKRGDSAIQKRVITYSPITQSYTSALNKVARKIYEISDNTLYLNKAVEYAAKANEFFEEYNAMNTYALLLYKTGKKDKAIDWQKKAIALKSKIGLDAKNLEQELKNMKEGKQLTTL